VERNLEEKILQLLKGRLLTTSEIARKLKLRRDLVAGYLKALVDQKKIKMYKVGRAYVYSLKEA